MTQSGGHTEIEVKLRVRDAADASQRMERAGFSESRPRVLESNTLFDTPDAVLRTRRCMLRIRMAGSDCLITFKGPAEETRYKSRKEIEFTVSSDKSAVDLLRSLGYQETFRYEKWRTEFQDGSGLGVATLDETPIGVFLELEGEPSWIDETAAKLGFSSHQYVTASYGRLYLQYCADLGLTPTHMLFSGTRHSP